MYNTKTNHRTKNDVFPQIDRVLGEIFNTNFDHFIDEKKVGYTYPASNVLELKDRFVIELAIPGMSKEDIKINLDKKVLSVSADKETKDEGKFRMKEFKFGKFSRQFKIPNAADLETISAEMTNGILSISINKRKEEIDNGPKEIKVS